MTNLEKYDEAFTSSLRITQEQLGPDLVFESVSNWDSVGHMELVAALEDVFDIMMETDDIINLSSYEIGKAMLSEKYGVSL